MDCYLLAVWPAVSSPSVPLTGKRLLLVQQCNRFVLQGSRALCDWLKSEAENQTVQDRVLAQLSLFTDRRVCPVGHGTKSNPSIYLRVLQK